MEWVRKIENYFQTPKVSTRKALDLLVQAIAETNKFVEITQSSLKSRALAHLSLAEEQHNAALKHFQQEEYSACQRLIEQSSTHLQMAQMLLDGLSEVETNTIAASFDFPKDSTEYLLNYLLESIARTKLIVESGNLHVSQKAQDILFETVKVAKHSLSALKNEETKDARHFCVAALLLLTRVCALLSIDNRQSSWKIEFPETAIDEPVARVRHVIDEMTNCLNLIADAGIVNSAKIERHFKEAEEHLGECVAAIMDGEIYSVGNSAVAALSELDLCRQLSAHSASTTESDDERAKFSADRSFKALESESAKIVRIAQKVAVRDFRIFQRRMDSTLVYFGRAAFQFKEDNLPEALRLATAAYLDLDFAWQIALTTAKPEYRDTEF
ncbi:MAG: hypothetical protein P4L53_25510 [Candidatus Obscuribacterales bacterium]|nr:hypothetical protein [Candidatus Obscuribacterales bacterium]